MDNINYFSIYYINFEKVFEVAMLLDNKEVISIEENAEKNHKVKIGAKIQATIKMIYSAFAEGTYEYNSIKSTKKTIEMKYTNAVFLKSIMDEIVTHRDNLSERIEGQLAIEDVRLTISNEDEMRNMKLVKRGLLDKFIHEDISVGEMMKTISEDYSYLLTSNKDGKKVLIKIPSKLENEFENNYTIDDLLNGTTTVVGVYRGIRNLKDFKSTYQYLAAAGQESSEEDEVMDEIIESSSEHSDEEQQLDEDDYHYLDVLAVIQKIEL